MSTDGDARTVQARGRPGRPGRPRRPVAASPLARRPRQRDLALRRQPRVPRGIRRNAGSTSTTGARSRPRSTRFPNYRVELDGQVVHYVHVPGNGPDPLPTGAHARLAVELLGLPQGDRPAVRPRRRYGGDPADAFDVIVPSIPGYGFSTPMRPGSEREETAGLWVRLVRDVLGLDRFVTAGGDWGAVISIMMGHLHPDDLRGVYVTLPNFAPALRNRFEGFELDDLYPDERDGSNGSGARAHARADRSSAPTATCTRPRPTPTPVPTARSRWRSRSSTAVAATARRTATSSPCSPAKSSSPT